MTRQEEKREAVVCEECASSYSVRWVAPSQTRNDWSGVRIADTLIREPRSSGRQGLGCWEPVSVPPQALGRFGARRPAGNHLRWAANPWL